MGEIVGEGSGLVEGSFAADGSPFNAGHFSGGISGAVVGPHAAAAAQLLSDSQEWLRQPRGGDADRRVKRSGGGGGGGAAGGGAAGGGQRGGLGGARGRDEPSLSSVGDDVVLGDMYAGTGPRRGAAGASPQSPFAATLQRQLQDAWAAGDMDGVTASLSEMSSDFVPAMKQRRTGEAPPEGDVDGEGSARGGSGAAGSAASVRSDAESVTDLHSFARGILRPSLSHAARKRQAAPRDVHTTTLYVKQVASGSSRARLPFPALKFEDVMHSFDADENARMTTPGRGSGGTVAIAPQDPHTSFETRVKRELARVYGDRPKTAAHAAFHSVDRITMQDLHAHGAGAHSVPRPTPAAIAAAKEAEAKAHFEQVQRLLDQEAAERQLAKRDLDELRKLGILSPSGGRSRADSGVGSDDGDGDGDVDAADEHATGASVRADADDKARADVGAPASLDGDDAVIGGGNDADATDEGGPADAQQASATAHRHGRDQHSAAVARARQRERDRQFALQRDREARAAHKRFLLEQQEQEERRLMEARLQAGERRVALASELRAEQAQARRALREREAMLRRQRLKEEAERKAARRRAAAMKRRQAAEQAMRQRMKDHKLAGYLLVGDFMAKYYARALVLLHKVRKKMTKGGRKERLRAARETTLMLKEEWLACRLQWYSEMNLGGLTRADGAWVTVRVFISSTFTDMHGERDVLTRTVFPALNELTKTRRVRVIPVDLRWGLTAEDTSDAGLGALEHCLLEIDNCRPFIMVLGGERYGWIPPGYRVSDRPEFKWVSSFEPTHSITAMEIFHGFLLRNMPAHAFAYFRDGSFTSEIEDPDLRRVFEFDYPGNNEVRARRDALRDAMIRHRYCHSRSYQCHYGGVDETGKQRTSSLHGFEAAVLDDLYNAVCYEFAKPPTAPTPDAQELALHMHFAASVSRSFIGRRDVLADLTQRAVPSAGRLAEPSVPLVVCGEPGTGKTTVMAAFVMYFKKMFPKVHTLVHFTGASPTSTDIRETLMRWWRELHAQFHVSIHMDQDDFPHVREGFQLALARAGRKALEHENYILLVVDAVNSMHESYNAHDMSWMPLHAPPGVEIIMSMPASSAAYASLLPRNPAPDHYMLSEMTHEDRAELVRRTLWVYRKKLTSGQMEALLAKRHASKPVYIVTACEELRLQAQYGMGGSGVDDTIAAMPQTVSEMLDVVLKRVEHDMDAWVRTAGANGTALEHTVKRFHHRQSHNVKLSRQATHARVASIGSGLGGSQGGLSHGRRDTASQSFFSSFSKHTSFHQKDIQEVHALLGIGLDSPLKSKLQHAVHKAAVRQDSARKMRAKQVSSAPGAGGDSSSVVDSDAADSEAGSSPSRSLPMATPPPRGSSSGGMALAAARALARRRESVGELVDVVVVDDEYVDDDDARSTGTGEGPDGHIGGSASDDDQDTAAAAAAMEAEVSAIAEGAEEAKGSDEAGDATPVQPARAMFGDKLIESAEAREGAPRASSGDEHGGDDDDDDVSSVASAADLTEEEAGGAGAALVRTALRLLYCSRYGLTEEEMLELLAPEAGGKLQRVVWARLYRSLELYLRPPGSTSDDGGVLAFFHSQMRQAVKARYFRRGRVQEEVVHVQLIDFFRRKADPDGDGTWNGGVASQFEDLVYYQLAALQLRDMRETLGSVMYVRARARQGAAGVESLLRDYHDAVSRVSDAKYSMLKAHLRHDGSDRHAVLGWLNEFITFVAANSTRLIMHPSLTFQYALNQPDSTEPHLQAADLVRQQCLGMIGERAYRQKLRGRAARRRRRAPVDGAVATAVVPLHTRSPSAGSKALDAIVALRQEMNVMKFVELTPRRWLSWTNRPQQNRVVAEYSGLAQQVTASAAVPKTSMLVALGFSGGSIHVIDCDTGKIERDFVGAKHQKAVTCLLITHDGHVLVSGGEDSMVRVWDATTGAHIVEVPGHERAVTALVAVRTATSNKGSTSLTGAASSREPVVFASAGLDNSVRLWQEHASRHGVFYDCVWENDWQSSAPLSLAFSVKHECLFVGCKDGTVEVWDTHAISLGLVKLSKFLAHDYSVTAAACSPTGSLLATAGGAGHVKMWLWEPPMGIGGEASGYWREMRGATRAHGGVITCVSWSEDERRVVCGATNKRLVLLDAVNRVELLTLQGHSSTVTGCWFLGKGTDRVVSSGLDKTVKVWDVSTADVVLKEAPPDLLDTLLKNKGPNKLKRRVSDEAKAWPHAVLCVEVSPMGDKVVSGSRAGDVKVWNLVNAAEETHLVGHVGAINAVEFTEKGELFVSGDDLGMLVVWDGHTYDHIHTIRNDDAGGVVDIACCYADACAGYIRKRSGSSASDTDGAAASATKQKQKQQAGAGGRRDSTHRSRRNREAAEAAEAAKQEYIRKRGNHVAFVSFEDAGLLAFDLTAGTPLGKVAPGMRLAPCLRLQCLRVPEASTVTTSSLPLVLDDWASWSGAKEAEELDEAALRRLVETAGPMEHAAAIQIQKIHRGLKDRIRAKKKAIRAATTIKALGSGFAAAAAGAGAAGGDGDGGAESKSRRPSLTIDVSAPALEGAAVPSTPSTMRAATTVQNAFRGRQARDELAGRRKIAVSKAATPLARGGTARKRPMSTRGAAAAANAALGLDGGTPKGARGGKRSQHLHAAAAAVRETTTAPFGRKGGGKGARKGGKKRRASKTKAPEEEKPKQRGLSFPIDKLRGEDGDDDARPDEATVEAAKAAAAGVSLSNAFTFGDDALAALSSPSGGPRSPSPGALSRPSSASPGTGPPSPTPSQGAHSIGSSTKMTARLKAQRARAEAEAAAAALNVNNGGAEDMDLVAHVMEQPHRVTAPDLPEDFVVPATAPVVPRRAGKVMLFAMSVNAGVGTLRLFDVETMTPAWQRPYVGEGGEITAVDIARDTARMVVGEKGSWFPLSITPTGEPHERTPLRWTPLNNTLGARRTLDEAFALTPGAQALLSLQKEVGGVCIPIGDTAARAAMKLQSIFRGRRDRRAAEEKRARAEAKKAAATAAAERKAAAAASDGRNRRSSIQSTTVTGAPRPAPKKKAPPRKRKGSKAGSAAAAAEPVEDDMATVAEPVTAMIGRHHDSDDSSHYTSDSDSDTDDEEESNLNDISITAVALSPDGKMLVAGRADGAVGVFDAARPQAGPLSLFYASAAVESVTIGAVCDPSTGSTYGPSGRAGVYRRTGPKEDDLEMVVPPRGFVVVGDQTGEVYILRLEDLLQFSEDAIRALTQ